MRPCNHVTPKTSLNSTICVLHEPFSSNNCFSHDMFVLVHFACLFVHKSSVKVRHWMLLEKIQNNCLELLYGDLFGVIVYYFWDWIDALLSPLDIFYAFCLHVGDGPLEGLVGKLPDAIEKRIGGLGLNCSPNGWLDDIAKI